MLERFKWLFVLLGVIWAVQVLNLLSGYSLNGWFGLLPRSFGGLDGILLMPFLHGSIMHAVSNTFAIIALGGLMAVTARHVVLPVSALIIAAGGFGVWMFGKTAIHVGASGLIFGWFAYLLARGFVEKSLVTVLVAAGVALFYGSMIWGVLPGQPGVSWEAHLFGAAAGVLASFVFRDQSEV